MNCNIGWLQLVLKAVSGARRPREARVASALLGCRYVSFFERANTKGFDDRYFRPAKTVLELDMLQTEQALRAKDGWREKVLRPDIAAKWLAEAAERLRSPSAAAHVMARLAWAARGADGVLPDPLLPGNVPCTLEADGLIPVCERDALRLAVAAMEEKVPRDEHPGSEGRVVNLVHPSLFPIVYGTTFLSDGTLAEPPEELNVADNTKCIFPSGVFTSKQYAWLPAEVKVDAEGRASFISYVNNLDPGGPGAALYAPLSAILTRFLPIFERILSDIKRPQRRLFDFDFVAKRFCTWLVKATGPHHRRMVKQAREKDAEEPTLHHAAEDLCDKCSAADFLTIPEWSPPPSFGCNAPSLSKRRLQVIVKLASIELSPEKPDYKGGVWHLEGTANERIVASGIYYYDEQNVTSADLNFRRNFSVGAGNRRMPAWEGHPDQSGTYFKGKSRVVEALTNIDWGDQYKSTPMGMKRVWGIKLEDLCLQELGAVRTREGLCLAWPNTMQHRLSPFGLKDSSRKGHRKILVFWLVDPYTRVVSSADVPPQSAGWSSTRLKLDPQGSGNTIDLTTALEHRVKLMQERSRLDGEFNLHAYGSVESADGRINFCEH